MLFSEEWQRSCIVRVSMADAWMIASAIRLHPAIHLMRAMRFELKSKGWPGRLRPSGIEDRRDLSSAAPQTGWMKSFAAAL